MTVYVVVAPSIYYVEVFVVFHMAKAQYDALMLKYDIRPSEVMLVTRTVV